MASRFFLISMGASVAITLLLRAHQSRRSIPIAISGAYVEEETAFAPPSGEPLAVEDETPPLEDETPGERLAVEDETPGERLAVKDETPPLAEDETPPLEDETPPLVKDETPPLEDETPPLEDETPPLTEDETPPLAEDETPPLEDETPPLVKDETPPLEDETPPLTEDETPPLTEDETPPLVDEKAIEDETPPLAEDETPPLEDETPPLEDEALEGPDVLNEIWKAVMAVEEVLYGKGHLHRRQMGNYGGAFMNSMIDYFAQIDALLRTIRFSVGNCDLVSIKALAKSVGERSESVGALGMVYISKTMEEVLDDMERVSTYVKQLQDELSLLRENVLMLCDLDYSIYALMGGAL